MGSGEVLMLIKPQLFILVPVLIIIGAAIKKTNLIRNWAIPLVLGVLGMIISVLILGFDDGFTPKIILDGILQGILSAGMAVYTHQLTIQTTVNRLNE